MRSPFWLVTLFVLGACARAPLSAERRGEVNQVSAASFLGSEFVFEYGPRSRDHSLDVAAWNVDANFTRLLGAELATRGREFIPFTLDEKALARALALRETRWQKVAGKQSQALLDLLFEAADRQGVRYFFLLVPLVDRQNFPAYRGFLGTACDGARAYAYFLADFSLWDVAHRRKVYEDRVDPSLTRDATFGSCDAVAAASEPIGALEDPVKRTMAHLTEELFRRMGWNPR